MKAGALTRPVLRVDCRHCDGRGYTLEPGPNLRKMRQRAGLGLREMARRTFLSAPYLSDVELGRRFLSKTILAKYQRHCGAKP